jgi:hypothetical protein
MARHEAILKRCALKDLWSEIASPSEKQMQAMK